VRELRPGLWHWDTPHPEWTEGEPWPQTVSSYAIDDGERLLLFDPLAVPSEIEERAADRKPVIVLTAPWHERDTQSLLERLDAPVYAPPPDTAEDLMERFGITREQAGEGSPDLAWLRAGDRYEAHFYTPADRPMGAEVFPGRVDKDDFGRGLEIVPGWLPPGVTREQIAERLRPLLELPVELVLAAHGGPFDRAALGHALS
jgi:hypothetical protein